MKKLALILSCVVIIITACKKDFLNTKPASGTFTANQARELSSSSPASAIKLQDASIKGIYAFMRSWNTLGAGAHDDFGQKAVDLGLDLMTEDMVQTTHHWFGFDYLVDNREETYRRPRFVWNFYYKIIYNSNILIDQIPASTTDNELRAIRGQALALRAYSYHYLVQLFQKTYKGNENALGVPLYTTPTTEGKPRSSVQEVYTQILADLNEAIPLLQGWTSPTKEQINQRVANGILARVHLSMENWSGAEAAANKAKQGYSLMSTAQYKEGFSDISNPEWMWGQVITSQTTTIFASFFSHIDNTIGGYAGALAIYKSIDKKLYDQIPATDVRKEIFNDPPRTIRPALPSYAQLKFRDPGSFTGDYIFMRVAEMYLIEAEAQARQGNNDAAQTTLFNLISKRNSAYTKSTSTGNVLIEEILLQKRIELWGEGMAFLDLKRLKRGIDRTGSNHRTDAVLVIPGDSPKWTYKIPLLEFETNRNMPKSEQNP